MRQGSLQSGIHGGKTVYAELRRVTMAGKIDQQMRKLG